MKKKTIKEDTQKDTQKEAGAKVTTESPNDTENDSALDEAVQKAEKKYLEAHKEYRTVSPARQERQRKVAELAQSEKPDDVNLAAMIMINDTKNYIDYMVNALYNYGNKAVVDNEDVIQTVYTHIYETIRKYNPQNAFTTWVNIQIKRSIQESRSNSFNMSSYYMQQHNIIAGVIAEYNARGIANPSPKDIQVMIPTKSLKTIINAMYQKTAATTTSILDDNYSDIMATEDDAGYMYGTTPENAIIKQETSKSLSAALMSLDEIERRVVISKVVDKQSWVDLARDTGIQQEELKKIYARSLKKLRYSEHLIGMNRGPKDNDTRFNQREISICPLQEGMSILDDLDIMDGIDPSDYHEDIPDVGIRNFGDDSDASDDDADNEENTNKVTQD